MREIKFRVWCRNRNEWEKDICFIGLDGDVYQQRFASPVMLPVNKKNHIIMQYTGLKDKNGVEIYEGDLVQVVSGYGWEQISDVVWGLTDRRFGNYPAFSMPEIETELNSFSEVFDSGDYEVEVIGNIYENSELLEVQND